MLNNETPTLHSIFNNETPAVIHLLALTNPPATSPQQRNS
jgi:hypothetical protein